MICFSSSIVGSTTDLLGSFDLNLNLRQKTKKIKNISYIFSEDFKVVMNVNLYCSPDSNTISFVINCWRTVFFDEPLQVPIY